MQIQLLQSTWILVASFFVAISLPIITGFVAYGQLEVIKESVDIFGTIVNSATIVAVSLAFLFFFWNLALYILRTDEKDDAKKKMIWSLIAILIITSLWGIIVFLRGVLGIENQTSNDITLPGVIIRDSRS